MPLENSVFRIVHRTAQDPHGDEGYFIHELYLNPDHTLRGWRAGVSIGAPSVKMLEGCLLEVAEAFLYEPIEHKDLKTGMKVSCVLPKVSVMVSRPQKLEESCGE